MSNAGPKQVVVVGTGYVGLPAAILLANAGLEVTGVDIDKNIVDAINANEMHIDEAELQTRMWTIAARPVAPSIPAGSVLRKYARHVSSAHYGCVQ